ncbi:ABC transporter ATP-binding protein [Microaceticoccus formicicus]|uniref:ABC transporter ATP-binding protein n=1 Tax=Microaceticoccus formicicus TaxID=3118105 RepID=UPI003CD01B55|nr:ABC transporter ATP-binding protein [Peptoniphilaceae bacterium AMB_02]
MLEVKDLNVYYGNIHALKGISLEVHEGEIISLIGANGAGKTTTLQTISGIIRSKSGSIHYKGEDITKTRAHKILRMGIAQVPEGRQIFANLSVLDNLELGAFSIRGSNEEKVAQREQFFDGFPRMRERANQRAGTLSGGEQQMLAMGRAMASKPKLMILDEPSMGLSPIFVKEIFSTIKRLNEEGVTILLVEQNAMMALAISDRAYVLETGKIVMEGNSKELANDEKVKQAYLGA